jgi:hypothetical protein
MKPRRYRLVHHPASERRAWIVQGKGEGRHDWVDIARYSHADEARRYLKEILDRQFTLIEANA